MEVWKDVVGYEGFYAVSDLGRVKRIHSTSGTAADRVLKPATAPNGDKIVVLSVRAVPKTQRVHRLVAQAFLGAPPSEEHVVTHLDGNLGNNRLSNLRWVTRAESSFGQVLRGTQKGRHHGRPAALTDAQVRAIRKDPRPSALVAKDYGLHRATVGQILRRETYKHIPPSEEDVPPKRRPNFSDDEVRSIRRDPRGLAAIADAMRCGKNSIRDIKSSKTYQHVPDTPLPSPPDTPKTPKRKTEANDVTAVGDTALLGLPNGFTALLDVADMAMVTDYVWRARKGKNTHYVSARQRDSKGTVKTVFLHQLLMAPPEGLVVDHINGDGLDNRRQNLRVVTVAQNNLNSRVRKDSQSGLKGAFFDKRKNTYYSRIKVDGRYIWLGTFATAQEAAEAYAKASVKYHGAYGRSYLDDA